MAYIPKERQLPLIEDYEQLRQEGLAHLEALGSGLWTDFNVHDPGITLLEAMCYALTDLGYRTGFALEDLLADDPEGTPSVSSFFPARDILTCNPLTEMDFRKLLVDLPGIKNAWIYRAGEKEGVKIKGLYDILIEFDVDDEYGELNSNVFPFRLFYHQDEPPNDLVELELDVFTAPWQTISDDLARYDAFLRAEELTGVAFSSEWKDLNNAHAWSAELVVTFSGPDGPGTIAGIPFYIKGVRTEEELSQVRDNIELLGKGTLLGFYHGKLKRTCEVFRNLEYTLHAHRNFCEDFRRIHHVEVTEIGVCADVDLAPDVNIETVLAGIYSAIENYLSPEVQFHNLQELLDRGTPAEEIFNGPALQHGFLVTEELEKADLRRQVYTSDLVNLIMDIEGVKAVRNVLLTEYDEWGRPFFPSEPWMLSMDDRHKPQLNIRRSKILFYKDNLPFIVEGDREERMLKMLSRLRAVNRRSRILDAQQDFAIPAGQYLPLTDYTPLRHILPPAYGVGPAGLKGSKEPLRRGQARQLKAFLLFFDQLLAGYLAQLAHIKDLLSLNAQDTDALKRTYYQQFLIQDQTGADLYVDETGLQGTGPDSLQGMAESRETYLDRRNRFLDHLLARFAEQFTDYALLMHAIYQSDPGVAAQELIHDKISLLEQYPVISSQRGKGFNHRDAAHLWDSDNVCGLKKRVSKLLGMEDYRRRTLSFPRPPYALEIVEVESKPLQIVLKKDGVPLLQGLHEFDTVAAAEAEMDYLLGLLLEEGNYEFGATWFQVGVHRPEQSFVLLAQSVTPYASEEEARAAAAELRADLQSQSGREGFHVVEHLLLRPSDKVAVDPGDTVGVNFWQWKDPFSFRATVVLPYWMQRFTDRGFRFREYTDRLFRLEAPAHVYLRICWVNNRQMRDFEKVYQEWLEVFSEPFPDENLLDQRRRALMGTLADLKNIYYHGILHDCIDGDNEDTIILDKTFLGTHNPT